MDSCACHRNDGMVEMFHTIPKKLALCRVITNLTRSSSNYPEKYLTWAFRYDFLTE